MKNNQIRYVPYLRNSIAYDHYFWYTCVKWWYLQTFFSVFQNFDFWVHRGLKGQKAFQNDKNFCLSCSISQEPYIIWLSFMVQVCKMVLSPGVLFNFKILIFRVVRGLKGQKITQNDKSLCLPHFIFQNHISYDLHLW